MRSVLLCCVVLLTACQGRTVLPSPAPLAELGRDHADFGRIYDLASGEVISPQQLLERLTRVERVLVGEQHDNPDHHALQLWLSRELSAQRAQGSVLMEMISPAQQDKVSQAQIISRAGQVPRDAFQALDWQPGWDWSLYGPLVLHELGQPYPLLSANLDRSEIMTIYLQRPQLSGEHSTVQAVQDKLLADIRDSHCGLLPERQMPAMLAVQQQRDRRMAEAVQQAPQPSLLLAGAFHVRKDLGVPLHLADLRASGEQAVLMLAEVGHEVDADMADYVWFTAAQPEEDHCAKLRP